MNKPKISLLLTVASISFSMLDLTACTSMHDILPKQGPSMEHIYDGMGKNGVPNNAQDDAPNASDEKEEFTEARKNMSRLQTKSTDLSQSVSVKYTWNHFHKVPNPTLTLYIYPHLSGSDELPIPGYTTAFNAYEKDHYALPNDI